MPVMEMINLSFAGTLTCVKSLVMCVESILPPCPNNSQ
jgi:hypothetical protein